MRSSSTLARLGEETWGERLLRAQRRSGCTYDMLTRMLDDALGLKTSPASLSQLMREAHLPTNQGRRMLALACVLAMGFEPEELGFTEATIPKTFDVKRAKELLLSALSRCTTDSWLPTLPAADDDLALAVA